MSVHFDLILKGGTCLTPGGRQVTDIGVCAGRIAALGDLAGADADERFDADGLHLLPGVIDSQVHFREPGLEHKEDLASGSAGAALGGVTGFFEMPNTKPGTLSAADLADKLARAAGRVWTDHAFYVGAAAENVDALADLERLPGCAGIKVFMGSSTGSLLVPDDATLARVLAAGFRRIAVHCEDEDRLEARKADIPDGAGSEYHPVWRDEETALAATRRLTALARAAGRRVHVLHVTTDAEMALLADFRDVASVEVTPQHLTFAAPDCYERLGSLAQMNPPIRAARHRDALWRAVRDGLVDVVGSDHAPHTREEKARPYPQCPSGMTGVQTLLPVLLDHVAKERLTLERLVDLTSAGPARLFGLAGKGRIALGNDADFSVVDLKARRRISNDWIASKSGWTPYDGMTVTGWPVATVLRGRFVMREDELQGAPEGRPLRFTECLPPAPDRAA